MAFDCLEIMSLRMTLLNAPSVQATQACSLTTTSRRLKSRHGERLQAPMSPRDHDSSDDDEDDSSEWSGADKTFGLNMAKGSKVSFAKAAGAPLHSPCYQ